MNQQIGPRHMPQEFVSQTLSLMRPFDEPRNIGYDETLPLVITDNPEVRNQSRKRIVGNLRTDGGDRRDQRRLTRVRQPNNAHISQQPELDLQLQFDSGHARLSITRAPVRRLDKMSIALPSSTAC